MEESHGSASRSNTLETQDINQEEMIAMEGDKIGNTVYSSQWLFKILLSVTEVNKTGWTDEIEANLCTLWDMTTEKAVIELLVDVNFIKITSMTLQTTRKPRILEIFLGILGNMCSQPTVIELIGNDEELCKQLMILLYRNESNVLIQLIRIMQAVMWDIKNNSKTVWVDHFKNYQDFGNITIFYLQSSTNENLLISTISLYKSIKEIDFTTKITVFDKILCENNLFSALIESFSQLITKDDTRHSNKAISFLDDWLDIFCYLVKSKKINFEVNQLQKLKQIEHVLLTILQPYKFKDNLVMLSEKEAFIVYESIDILSDLQYTFMNAGLELNYTIIHITHGLKTALDTNESNNQNTESNNILKNLLEFLVTYSIKVLDIHPDEVILHTLKLCTKEVTSHFLQFLKEHDKMPSYLLQKLYNLESFLHREYYFSA